MAIYLLHNMEYDNDVKLTGSDQIPQSKCVSMNAACIALNTIALVQLTLPVDGSLDKVSDHQNFIVVAEHKSIGG